eukprot:4936275-Pleurochrysis_carterae.AAC.1
MLCDMTLPSTPIIHANGSMCKLCGYQLYELLGRSYTSLYSEHSDRDAVAVLDSAWAQARPVCVNFTCRRRDGESQPCLFASQPIFDAQGDVRLTLCLLFPVSPMSPLEQLKAKMAEMTHLVPQHLDDGVETLVALDAEAAANGDGVDADEGQEAAEDAHAGGGSHADGYDSQRWDVDDQVDGAGGRIAHELSRSDVGSRSGAATAHAEERGDFVRDGDGHLEQRGFHAGHGGAGGAATLAPQPTHKAARAPHAASTALVQAKASAQPSSQASEEAQLERVRLLTAGFSRILWAADWVSSLRQLLRISSFVEAFGEWLDERDDEAASLLHAALRTASTARVLKEARRRHAVARRRRLRLRHKQKMARRGADGSRGEEPRDDDGDDDNDGDDDDDDDEDDDCDDDDGDDDDDDDDDDDYMQEAIEAEYAEASEAWAAAQREGNELCLELDVWADDLSATIEGLHAKGNEAVEALANAYLVNFCTTSLAVEIADLLLPPLTSISSFSELLWHEYVPPPDCADFVYALARVFTALPVAAFLCDLTVFGSPVVLANETLRAVLGFPMEEILGCEQATVLHPHERARRLEDGDEQETGTSFVVRESLEQGFSSGAQLELQTETGESLPCLVAVRPIADQTSFRLCLMLVAPITESLSAETAMGKLGEILAYVPEAYEPWYGANDAEAVQPDPAAA